MSFADAYLLKAGLRKALIEPEPHPGNLISVIIPVYNESGLERCLDSLFRCSCEDPPQAGQKDPPQADSGFHAEVLILINAASDAPPAILEQNLKTLAATRSWIAAHPHPSMDFHVWLDHSLGKKEAGVGMARKILMDEAVRRFGLLDRPSGIIASTDADAIVQSNYLETLVEHFKGGSAEGGPVGGAVSGSVPDGCSIRFEHPLGPDSDPGASDQGDSDQGDSFSPAVYKAITQYELHLRYYVQSMRSTGYPYAYHTVGSSFAIRSDIYCMEGGMNRRQAGEDFYFIQKMAQRGNFSQCNSTCVVPSSRPSDRVPFGTGLAITRLSQNDAPLMTYDPRPFGMLKELFSFIGQSDRLAGSWPEPLQAFLEKQDFRAALKEIESNSASPEAFRKRFWRWFNMFRIMKFLHFARERGYEDIRVEEAALSFLKLGETMTMEQLLTKFRELDRYTVYP